MTDKFCVDCKHCHWSERHSMEAYRCYHPQSQYQHPVDGRKRDHTCVVMRNEAGLCGLKARYFEAKEDKVLLGLD